MFKEARIKLTVWYLVIIMAISLSFSVAIFIGVNRELVRFETLQNQRQARTERINAYIKALGLPVIPDQSLKIDNETVEAARVRIITVLGLINLSILAIAGAGGYFLAGQTLEPIKKNMDEQKEFVSNASHELRTPLTSLMSEIEVSLRDKNLSLTDAKNLLKSNLEEVKKMNGLSNYLLKLDKFQAGRSSYEFKDLDLKEIANKAISKTESLARAKKIKIVSNLKKSTVNGNEESLIELATILIDNAIKYSSKGKSIDVKVADKKLEIRDRGIGISENDMPHIFDRFYRADSSRSKEKIDGYGLGLSIAKQIIDLHKAKIIVNSKLNLGTSFKVVFS